MVSVGSGGGREQALHVIVIMRFLSGLSSEGVENFSTRVDNLISAQILNLDF